MMLWSAYVCVCDTISENSTRCPSCGDTALIPISRFVKPVSNEQEIESTRVAMAKHGEPADPTFHGKAF